MTRLKSHQIEADTSSPEVLNDTASQVYIKCNTGDDNENDEFMLSLNQRVHNGGDGVNESNNGVNALNGKNSLPTDTSDNFSEFSNSRTMIKP